METMKESVRKHDMLNIEDIKNTIICGDCLEVMKQLPDKCVDLICTDPPYGLNYNNGDLASQREKVFGGKQENLGIRPIANDGQEEAIELFEKMLIEAKRVLKKGACCCCCCCGGGPKPLFAEWTLLMDKHIGFKHAVVWDKGGLGMGIHYRRNYEFVLIAQNGQPAHRWNGGNNTPNVWRINKIIPRADQHPTEKPVELMKKIIKIHSNEGDIVFDPFAGHGSTCVAAELMGRNWIGVEINPDFHRRAVEKTEESKTQYALFAGQEAV